MNTSLAFDSDLLERYDRSGPRYTSYPTVPQFTTAFGPTQLREYASRTNAAMAPRPLSLYVHVPFCSSPCFYCGCSRIITRDTGKGAEYLRRLQQEIALTGCWFDSRRPVVQLHFGGGTPNFLRPEQLGHVVGSLKNHFNLSTGLEYDFSIELDPRLLEAGDIEALARIGFNRVSFGVQDFTPEVQRAINRIQSPAQTLVAIDACRASGFRSVNVDLIYGLPHQSVETFGVTLDTLIARRPDRFAIYSYAHMPQLFRAQRRIHSRDLPDPGTKLQLLELAVQRLEAAGYQYIGMDHFALPEDELARAQRAGQLQRNFMGYTTHANCDLIGLGASAISHIGDSFSQNARDMDEWGLALDQGRVPVWRGLEMTNDDRIRADVIQQLMCHGQIDIGAVERRHEIDFLGYFMEALRRLHPLVSDGLVTVSGNFIVATARGRLLLRVIAMCFDHYLECRPASAQQAAFSKLI